MLAYASQQAGAQTARLDCINQNTSAQKPTHKTTVATTTQNALAERAAQRAMLSYIRQDATDQRAMHTCTK